MAFRYNPFTGTFDIVSTLSNVDIDCVILLNSLYILSSGNMFIEGDGCISVKNASSILSQTFNNSITITSAGEMIIQSGGEVEVIG